MLDRLRLVLSEEELALTRAADAIADIGQERLIELITPGASARDWLTRCAPQCWMPSWSVTPRCHSISMSARARRTVKGAGTQRVGHLES